MTTVVECLRLFIANQFVPLVVGVALAGGVSGLVATMVGWGNVWPYSLIQTGMNSNTMVDLSASGVAQIVVLSAVYSALALAWACRWLSRRDVVATK